MDGWEALWAKERDASVARAKSEKLGKSADGKTLNGPAGFTIDLSKCPAGWSDTEGLTDTEIKIGETGAASGPLGDSFSYNKAMHAMYDYYNEKGAFKDSLGKTRKIVYISPRRQLRPGQDHPVGRRADRFRAASSRCRPWVRPTP